ncbi:glycosyltransferase [Telmatocola sphagniphila]|uniref:glycosyltransferase n=1 Tax=Telmatocola sphagniphila TaxID=1123043 RepID=UPI001FE3BD5B|nr:glycosyltransferase [Telmatocola sphagniphila]
MNRQFLYPLYLSKLQKKFDCFHIVDHSYAQLVHHLPRARTGVYCHDLDAFRCILEPSSERRPHWFRAMSRRILTGMQKAAIIFYNSKQTYDQIVKYQLVDSKKLTFAPLGVSSEFNHQSFSSVPWLDSISQPFVLHVGSCIARKRVDVVLDTLARLRTNFPEIRLVKVGGDFTSDQVEKIESLNLAKSIVHKKSIPRTELAECYRRARVVLVSSESEGFGLPVIEALACGSLVVASDIAPLRESGSDAVIFLPVADITAWTNCLTKILSGEMSVPSITNRLNSASRYSWEKHSQIILDAYLSLA